MAGRGRKSMPVDPTMLWSYVEIDMDMPGFIFRYELSNPSQN